MNKVYILMFVPFGCPSYDTEVLGVYATKKSANAALKDKVASEEYPKRELFVVNRKLEV